MPRKSLNANMLLTALTIIFIILPGTNLTPFDGLPLNHVESLAAIIWLVLVWTIPWPRPTRVSIIIPVSIVVLIALQSVGAFYIPSGWSVCLRRGVAVDQLTTPCEPSAQFRLGDPTYILPTLNFKDRTFPLHFMNNMKLFNFHRPGEPDQQHLPYQLLAQAYFRPSRDASLTLTTSIPTQITVDDKTWDIPADNSATLTIPANHTSHVQLTYAAARQDFQHWQVTASAQPFTRPVFPAVSLVLLYQTIFYVSLFIPFLAMLFQVTRHFFQLTSRSQLVIALSFLALAIWWHSDQAPYLFFTLFTLSLGWHVFTKPLPQQRLLLAFLLILLLLATHRFVSVYTPYPDMTMGSVGRDTWAHLSVARNQIIARNWSEFIGQNPFYYQPMHQYILAVILKVMDESLWSIYLIQTFLAALGVTLTIRLFLNYSTAFTAFVFSIALLALNGFGFVQYPWLSPFNITNTTFQHGMATPLIILVTLCLIEIIFRRPLRPFCHLSLGLLMGLALMTRMDYLPMLAVVGVYILAFFWQHKIKRASLVVILMLTLGLAFFPSLVVLKNYLATHAIILSPTSTTMNAYSGFRHIVPYASKPITAGQMITKIIAWYQNNSTYYELFLALISNLKDNFVGSIFQHQLLWYISPTVGFFALLQGKKSERLAILILLLCFFSVVPINLFFRIHPASFDMHVIFDYWLIMLASFGLSILWRQRVLFKSSATRQ